MTVRSLVFSPDGNVLYSASDDGRVSAHDVYVACALCLWVLRLTQIVGGMAQVCRLCTLCVLGALIQRPFVVGAGCGRFTRWHTNRDGVRAVVVGVWLHHWARH